MKRLICSACLLAMLLSACSTTEEETPTSEGHYTHGVYQFTIKAKKLSNDHVGNNWSITYTYGGKTIKSGYRFTYPLDVFAFLRVRVEVRENDKIDDVGTGTLRVPLYDGASDKVEVTVTETNGMYKGRTAVWEIYCQIKMLGKT